MDIVYNLEQLPYGKMPIFLAGPTPRDSEVKSWRPDAIEFFSKKLVDPNYSFFRNEIALIVPEGRDGSWHGHYHAQCEWEHLCIEHSRVLMYWVPRDLETLPGFTTNVEFGLFIDKPHMVYGRPPGTPKTNYLDWVFYKRTRCKPLISLKDTVETAMQHLKSYTAAYLSTKGP